MSKSKRNRMLYLCEPKKNNECNKHFCFINGGECMNTKYNKYAIDYENDERKEK